MKTLDDIRALNAEFQKQYGIDLTQAQQQSQSWFQAKLGVISASNAKKAVAGRNTDTRLTYVCDLVAEVATGVIEEFNFRQAEWGKQQEAAARSSREFATNQKITEVSFVFKDDTFRVGCSPDGISDAPEEIKCPWDSANFVKFFVAGVQKDDWVWQNQMTLWVMDSEVMYHSMYDPRMKTKSLHTIEVKKDKDMQKKLDDSIPLLIEDIDEALKDLGLKFGDQWTRLSLGEVIDASYEEKTS